MGTKSIDFMTLTLEFNLLFENLNITYNIWIGSARALIFHMSIPCEKILLLVLNLLTLTFDHFLKLTLFITTKSVSILHMVISCDKIFLLVSKYMFLWSWPSLELAIIGGICVSQTHLAFFFNLKGTSCLKRYYMKNFTPTISNKCTYIAILMNSYIFQQ